MKRTAFHILRVGVAITFLWVGILIFKEPEVWGAFLRPWATRLLPIPVKQAMIGTALLDVSLGFFLLANFWVWLTALIASFHLIIVLIVSGIDSITVRDIGLLAATVALFIESLPRNF